PEIYDDALYIGAVYPDGSKRLLRYNESSFTSVLDITSPVSTGIHLFLREGSLMIQPHYINGTNAYEYNGSTFTEIIAPAGKILFPYMNSTACTHLWLNYQSKDGSVTWSYAKEDKGCPPPAPAPAPVIPAHFKDYERFEITAYGPGRGWCWSDIIIDWDIVPYCPLPPCPDPNYEIRMTDPNNSTAWMQKFTSPTALQVPLQDIQGYRTTLSTPDNGWKDLVVFEPNLPEKGIGSIKLTMYPKNNYVLLSAATKNNQSVALRATLYNANGAVLWQQTFMAPFTQQINTLVQEPGQRLVFSIPDLVF
ncbi:MAG TPA: hypothetical protein VD996_12745, partial [Chitinophagaceae bacterium]|nr:hypothetical protein [Chitinophagaceae bacterium]